MFFLKSFVSLLLVIAFLIIYPVIPIYSAGEPQVESSIQVLVDSMKRQEKVYQSIVKNSVNTKTPGYREIGVINATGAKVISYARFKQGTLILTQNPLDFGIEGDGFFTIRVGDEYWYTRDGRFTINQDGFLVTLSLGYPVVGENGPIVIPESSERLQVTTSGKIYQGKEEIDTFKITKIQDKSKLNIINGTFFSLPVKSYGEVKAEDFSYTIRQGYYESSNIDLTQQLMNLPITRTMYDANAKAIKIRQRLFNSFIQDSLQNQIQF